MELNSSAKIISLHLQKCGNKCPNCSSCYYLKREKTDGCVIGTDLLRISLLNQGYNVYESVSIYNRSYHYRLLQYNNNYHITLSATNNIIFLHERMQISVYSLADIYKFNSIQKLFLIKDFNTYEMAKSFINNTKIKNLHILVDQDYVNAENIMQLIIMFNNRLNIDPSITFDNCITGFLINGECQYANHNYIDINYDSTVRRCPYEKSGVPLGNLDDMFRLDTPKCKYYKIFKGDN